jgi:DNA-binding NarL/FixJ family response regulator
LKDAVVCINKLINQTLGLNPDQRNGYRVLIIDDHPVFRQGLKQVITLDPQMEVVGEAKDGETALSLMRGLMPDIAVMDLDLPGMNGLELIEEIRRLSKSPAVLVLTKHREDQMVNAALDRGALGYLTRETVAAELVNAIHAVLCGRIYVTASLSGALVRRVRRAEALHDDITGLTCLTPTELRVLKLLSTSKTNHQIARRLFISPRIVEIHRFNICEKLGLASQQKLLQFVRNKRGNNQLPSKELTS